VGCSVDDHCDSGNMKLAIHVVWRRGQCLNNRNRVETSHAVFL
jgi:hypothetical protein